MLYGDLIWYAWAGFNYQIISRKYVIIIFSSKVILSKQDLSTVYIQHWDKNTDYQGSIGCVRVVWNDSLACCQEKYKLGKKKPTNSELEKQFIALAKKTEERAMLTVVSALATTAIFKRFQPWLSKLF